MASNSVQTTPAAVALHSPVELAGHVVAITGFALASYTGCQVSVHLRSNHLIDDVSILSTVLVYTPEVRLQNLFEAALTTGNAVSFHGTPIDFPPFPTEGRLVQRLYRVDSVTLTNAR